MTVTPGRSSNPEAGNEASPDPTIQQSTLKLFGLEMSHRCLEI